MVNYEIKESFQTYGIPLKVQVGEPKDKSLLGRRRDFTIGGGVEAQEMRDFCGWVLVVYASVLTFCLLFSSFCLSIIVFALSLTHSLCPFSFSLSFSGCCKSTRRAWKRSC
jgi:hypothetical protein